MLPCKTGVSGGRLELSLIAGRDDGSHSRDVELRSRFQVWLSVKGLRFC